MIVVVADDMTGAAEIAGVGLRYGLRVAFATEVSKLPEADVLVVATDTRSMRLKEAVKETKKVLSELKAAGISTIFKKTDSVIRGHVLAELEVAMEVFGKEKVLLIPANPATGRTVVNGVYYVNGVPLKETSFAEDPDFPASFSEVEKLLVDRYHPDISAMLGLSLTEVISVPDASSKEDLAAQAALIGEDTLPAGSAAFFEAFLRVQFPGQGRFFVKLKKFTGKSLIVCGSTHANSRKFIREAEKQQVPVVEIPPNLRYKFADEEDINVWADKVVGLLRQNAKVIVTVSPEKLNFDDSSRILKERLAKMVGKVLNWIHVDELFIEGGATAFAIVQEAGFSSFTPVNELRNGVVRMKVAGKEEMFMTNKPGSYLWPDNLLK